jgi:methionyl-tRNA formyltransferase
MTPLRLVFMGTPEFAVPALAALAAAGHDVVCVYTQPPRRAGRGHRATPSAVQQAAEAACIDVRAPETLKDADTIAAFAALDADAAVVAAYGLILPPGILAAPRLGCLNLHASLLPRWRGAAPIQRAILAGDAQTGVTVMRMDEGLDTGATVLAEAIPITVTTTAAQLHDRLAEIGARLMVDALDGLRSGRLVPVPQPDAGVTHARKLTRDEGGMNWRRPAAELDRLVRALNPWPGTWFQWQGERIRILAAEPVTALGGEPGAVLAEGALVVACGDGALRLTRLQRPGRAALGGEDFVRGFALPAGTRLPAAEGTP